MGNVVTDSGVRTPIGASDYMADASGGYGYLSESASTWLALHNRDFTDAVWAATNITPLKDATGADGTANGASTLTATANNGTILQTVTSASADRCVSCFVKRKTGTGTVEITADGGTTWSDVTSDIGSSVYLQVQATKAAVINPQVGFRLGTSGDEIEVDYFGLENSSFASSALETGAATTTRAADSLVYPGASNIEDATGTAILQASTLWDTAAAEAQALGRGVKILHVASAGADDVVKSEDGTNTATSATGTDMLNTPQPIAASWGDDLIAYINGTAGTAATFDGGMGTGNIGVGCDNAGANQWNGTLRLLEIHNKEGKV